MKKAVRAILVKNKQLLVMKRNKFGSEYYTLIGGHVEIGESTVAALHREVQEETMMQIANPRLVYIESAPAPYGDQYIYLCDYVAGSPELSPSSDELKINRLGKNIYTPMWLDITSLKNLPFRSEKLKAKILKHLKDGFPETTQKFSSISS